MDDLYIPGRYVLKEFMVLLCASGVKTSRLLKNAHLLCYPHPFLCPPRDRLLLGLLDHLQKAKAFDLVQ